jgi:hypothetical protein
MKDSLISTEIKEKLCRNFDDTNVIAGTFVSFDFECQEIAAFCCVKMLAVLLLEIWRSYF